ncbi:MAG TPA: metal-dependent transcriptional regulator [Abditibacterium sp.]|jgi:DtxR family Mn-dependent transcriptional regulator
MSHLPTEASLGRAPLSSAVEDYLKAIYTLREAGATTISTQSLANRLQVAPPSATAMLKKLDAMGLAHHEPYRGVHLSAAGEKIALEIVRHHRIIETFLSQILGLEWDKIHDEAERLEHVLSEEVEAKMAEVLGYPTRDPHGAPIPSVEGEVEISRETRLSEARAGFSGQICRVSDENAEVLRHLRQLGLVLGARVQVTRSEGVEGVVETQIEGRDQVVGQSPAQFVWLSEAV